mgnify:FL=1
MDQQIDTAQRRAEVEAVLNKCDVALTDWLRCYAPEEFTDEQVAETRNRLHGGTLAYVAFLRRDIKNALDRLREGVEG